MYHATFSLPDLPTRLTSLTCISSHRELTGLHLTFSSFTTSVIRHRHKAINRSLSTRIPPIKDSGRVIDSVNIHQLDYNLVASESYGGLGLLIYARADTICKSIEQVEISRASCGFLNLLNNKGALGIRITITEPSLPMVSSSPGRIGKEILTFVSAHLAAYDSGLMARNQDYQLILNKLLFTPALGSSTPSTIYDCNHLFFMGDLNYRITLTPPISMGKVQISQKDLQEMLQQELYQLLVSQYDTLTHQHQAKRVLVGLREGSIDFKPSYKYERTKPDRFVSFAHRLPGWTDRIFFTSWNDQGLSLNHDLSALDSQTEVVTYQTVQNQSGSDHKPVFGVFDIPDWNPDPTLRLLSSNPHYQRVLPDPWWREKLWIGSTLDRVVGIGFLTIWALGLGNMKWGSINLFLIIGWKLRKLVLWTCMITVTYFSSVRDWVHTRSIPWN